MSLSDQNRALIEREDHRDQAEAMARIYPAVLGRLLDAARAEGRPSPEGDLFRPGVLRCAKCNFRLVSSTLYVRSGTIAPKETTEYCPNDGAPMWRVSWKDECLEAEAEWEKQVHRAVEAEQALAALSTPSPEAGNRHVDDINDPILKGLANPPPDACPYCLTKGGLHAPGCDMDPAALSPPAPEPMREGVLAAAIAGISDDFMTSNDHHPGWVLIPQRKFDQLRDAEKALSVLPVPEPGYEAEPVAWIRPSDLAELGRITELAQWVFGRPDEMYSQPLYASPVPVAISREEIARTIAESYGVDPDDPAPLAVMCTADNQPVPWWEVYAEQADAILQRLSNQQGGGGKGSIPELPGVSAVQLPASTAAQHSDEGEG